jgi:hypothetical protein
MGRGMLLRPVRENREVCKRWYPDGGVLGRDFGRGRPDLANHAICLAAGHLEVDGLWLCGQGCAS